MEPPPGFINAFKVVNHIKTSKIECETLKKILDREKIGAVIDKKNEDWWLVKIDCPSLDVLVEKGYSMSGKFNGVPYFLEFTEMPSQETTAGHCDEEEYTGGAKVLLTNIPPNTTKKNLKQYFQNDLPFGGQVLKLHIGNDEAVVVFADENVANTVVSKAPLHFSGMWLHIRYDQALVVFADENVANTVVSKAPLHFNGMWLKASKIESDVPRMGSIETEVKEVFCGAGTKNIRKSLEKKLHCEVPEKKEAWETAPKKPNLPPKLKIETKTIIVHNVPGEINLEDLQMFFENKKRSGGGEMENAASRDPRTNDVEITYSMEEVAKRVVEKSPLTYKDCNLRVTLKQPLKEPSLPKSSPKKLSAQTDNANATIVVHGVPKGLSKEEVELYFENPKKSRGGEIIDFDDDRKNGIKITFASSNVARNVAGQKNHIINKIPLRVSMYVPPELEEKQMLVYDIKPAINAEYLQNFLEAKTDLDVEEIKKVKAGLWLVYSQNEIDFEKVKDLCKSKTTSYISETHPKIRRIPVTTKIIVSNIPDEENHKTVKNFFRNPRAPDEIVDCKMLPDRRCIITFKDCNIAKDMSRLTHDEFDINIYNDYVVADETYKDIPLSSQFWVKFLIIHKKVFEDELKDCGSPIWSKTTGNLLKIKCNEDIEEKQIKAAIEKMLATIHEERVDIPSMIFEAVKEESQASKEQHIDVFFDNENYTAHIFSFNKSKATDYYKKLSDSVESKSNIRKEIDLEAHEISLLMADFIPKIYQEYNKLKIKKEGAKLAFYGFSSDIEAVINLVYKFLHGVTSVPVQLSRNAHHILNKKPVKEHIQKKLKNKKYVCALQIDPENEIFIHSTQKNKLRPAIDILKKSIVDFNFQITEEIRKIMNGGNWQKFLINLSDTYADKFYMDVGSSNIAIVTIDQEAEKIGGQFEDFFATHVTYENTLPLNSGYYEYLNTYKKNQIEDYCRDHPPTIIRFKDDQALYISGPKKANDEASSFLKSLIQTIKDKKEVFIHLGFKKFLQTGIADTMLNNISSSHKCIILKTEDKSMNKIFGQTLTGGQVEYKSCKIIVQSGDITDLEVDAIVNAANQELNHVGGLARAIVKKGGQVIQDECHQIMASLRSAKLPEGSTKVTKAGNLKCKIIIHAVGPIWRNGENYETESLSEAVTNSLQIAEKKSYSSIAFPAISTGIYRFPLDKATGTILANIKTYLDNTPNTSLKTIYLVSITPDVITAFKQQLGSKFQNVAAPLQEMKVSRQVKPEVAVRQSSQPQVTPTLNTERVTPTSNTEIEIVSGLLNKTKCDAIVNTTNNAMDLSSGAISKAILSEAGRQLQDECSNLPSLSHFGIGVTNGYNLPCKKVIHISLPQWSQSSKDIVKTYLTNCLRKADELNFSHIAIPAFGTGNLGYPITIVANAMISAALEYTSTQETGLQRISFVIFTNDKAIYQAFEKAKRDGPTLSNTQTQQSNYQPSRNTEASNVSQQDNSFDINGINLKVITGSITEQTVDGIVHGTNQQFTLNGAITKALQQQIGHNFIKDCKAKVDEMVKNAYAITDGHSLTARYIIHIDVERIKKDASQIFESCFKVAEKQRMTSLALPPLGTGGLRCTLQYFVKSLLTALKDFAKTNPRNLKTVNLVIFDKKMFAEILKELSSQGKSQPSLFSSLKSYFMGDGSNETKKVPKAGRDSVAVKNAAPCDVNLFFYADSIDAIDRAKKEINSKYTSEYLISKDIKEDIIKELSDEQKENICSLRLDREVKIEFKTSKIILSGYKEDVIDVKEGIITMLMELTGIMHKEKAAKMTQKFVQWNFMSFNNGKPILKQYNIDINHQLEQAYQKKEKILKVPADNGTVVFDFTNPKEMFEYPENGTNNKIKIFRKDKSTGLPEHWDPMEDIHFLQVELKSGSEYDKVKKAFPNNFPIHKIHRIQNKTLYLQYKAQLDKMNTTNPPGTKNETEGLWHGTSEDATEKINQTGFNRSYCGKNAVAFGQGVYFAVSAQYSLSNTYSPPNAAGHKFMYYCNVLTGLTCIGNPQMRVPPDNPQVPGMPFDSTTNDLNSPSMYITFHDANAYPAYLIEC